MLKYNLKKTDTADKETLTHCLTVLKCILEESDDLMEQNKVGSATIKWREAEKYLKGYFKELFKQNKYETSKNNL